MPRERLATTDDGRYFLQRFMHYFPNHVPEKCGDVEPLKHVFDEGDLNHVLQFWGPWAFIAERKTHPTSLLDIDEALSSPYTPHRKIAAYLQFEQNEREGHFALSEFVYEVSNAFGAVYAAAHISTKVEAQQFARKNLEFIEEHPERSSEFAIRGLKRVLENPSGLMTTLHDIRTKKLRTYIPNLFWLSVFGPPYVKLFGEESILGAPANEVRKLPYGGIGVTLTEGIDENLESLQDFESMRDRAKRHLDSNAFFDKSLPRTHIYNAPDFGVPKDSLAERRERLRTALAEEMAGRKSAYDAMLDNPDKRTKPS